MKFMRKMIPSLKPSFTIKTPFLVVALVLFTISVNAFDFRKSESFYIDPVLSEKSILRNSLDLSGNDKTTFHLFSHGRSGELLLNGEWKNAEAIANFLNSKLKTQNTEISYLNIYGCEFAKGEKGKQAVSYLEKMLGVKVSASTNITGIDGDWILETGTSKSSVVITNYAFNLQCINDELITDSDGDGVKDSDDKDDDNDGILDVNECPGPATISNLSDKHITTTGTSQSFTANNGTTVLGVTLSSPQNAQARRFTYNGVTGYHLGKGTPTSPDEEITFTFSKPVTRVKFVTSAHGQNNSTTGERMLLEVNGLCYRFDPNYLVTSGTGASVTISSNGLSILGTASAYPATANFTYTVIHPEGITSIRLIHDVIKGGPNGTVYDVIVGQKIVQSNYSCDTDNDGIDNSLDLDSDGDGCPDAIEGGGNFTNSQLVSSSMAGGNNSVSGFTGTANPVKDNLGNNIDTNSGSANYGVPLLAGSGQGVSKSDNAGAEISITQSPSDLTYCSNAIPSTVKFKAKATTDPSSSNVNYQWKRSTNGGASFTNIPSSSGTVASNTEVTLNLTGITTADDGNVYKIVYTTTNNSCPEEAEATLTINLAPTVTINDIDTVCVDADSVQLSGTPATGGVFSGTGVNSSTGKFDPSTAGVGTHTIYHTYTSANGCSSSDSTKVVVKFTQAITLSVDTTSSIVCGEGTFTADFSKTTPSGTIVTWSSSQMSSGSGNISEQLSNNTSSPKTVSYYILAKSPNACSEKRDTIHVTVNPKPTVTPSVCEVTTCSRDSAIIDFSSTVDSTELSWIGDNGTSGTGVIREVLINSGSVNDTVTYSIIGTSKKGCKSDTVKCRVIVKPSPDITNAVVTNVSCKGDSMGAVDITTTGNSLTYSWSNGDTTEDVTKLLSGIYTVTVTDGVSSCTADTSVTITELSSSVLSVQLTKKNATNGANCMDGKAFSSVSGGTAPYTYSWSSGSTVDSAVNLTGSNGGVRYTLTVTDSLGCSGNSPYSVIVNCDNNCDASITIDSTKNVYCTGDSTGFAIASASSSANPSALFTFVWKNTSGVTLQTTPGAKTSTATGLPQGNYKVSVTIDGLTCQAVEQTITISEPLILQAVVTGTSETSLNSQNGTAVSKPIGGTAPYTYLWDSAAGYATVDSISGLSPGTYCVTVTDTNGCVVTGCYTVTEYGCVATAPELNTSKINVSCNGGNDGKINVSITNSSSVKTPVSYSWTPTATDTNLLTGLSAGNYSVTVTGNDGCFTTINTITITQPSTLSASEAVNHVKCKGDTGSIDVSVTGGVGPYNFRWSDDTTIVSEDRTGVTAGTYSVTITDSKGCITSINNIQVKEPAADLTATVDPTNATNGANPSCSDGSSKVKASGGTGPYTYVWSSNASIVDSAIGLTGSSKGITYTLKVTDANGCEVIESFVIGCNDICNAKINVDSVLNIDCNGNNTGTATVSASNGATPDSTFTFVWKNSSNATVHTTTNDTVSKATGLSQGTYTVSVTIDGLTCQAVEQTVVISQPSVLQAGVTGTNETGLSLNNGTAKANPTGGTSPYRYQWDSAAGNATTHSVSGLSPGKYCVLVTDTNGCTASGCYTVTEYQCVATAPQLSTTVANVSCKGASDGEITVNISNASSVITPVTYSWTPTAVDTNKLSGLSPGSFDVKVTGADGCFTTKSAIIVTEPDTLSVSAAVDDPNCFGENSGNIDVTASGGTRPYSYVWSDTSLTSEDRTGLSADTIILTVTDKNGCKFVLDSIVIDQPNEITIDSITSVSDATCGSDNGSFSVEKLVVSTNYEVKANLGSSFVSLGVFTSDSTGVLNVTGLAAGKYTNIIVEDQVLKCSSNSFTDSAVINEEGLIFGKVNKEKDTSCLGDSYTLKATVTLPGIEVYWRYDSIKGAIINTAQSNTLTITPTNTRCYIAEFLNKFSGCSSFDTICVAITKAPIAVNDACITTEEDSTSVDSIITVIAANDDYSKVLKGGQTYSVISTKKGNTVIDNSAGTISYTPLTNYVGNDTVTIVVCSDSCSALCDTSLLCYIVTPVTDTIVIPVPEDSTIVICPPTTSQVDSVTSVSLDCGPNHGIRTIVDSSTGCVTYVPDTNFVGTDTLCIVICDSIAGICDTTVTIIKVIPVTDTITILAQNDSSIAICPPSTSVLDSVTSVSLSCGPNYGKVILDSSTGCVTYIPDSSFTKVDTLCIVICDSIADVCDTTVVILIPTPQMDTIYVDAIPSTNADTCVKLESFMTGMTVETCSGTLFTYGRVPITITGLCVRYPVGAPIFNGDTTCIVVCDTISGIVVCDTTIIIYLADTTPPSITCKNDTVYLDAAGNVTIDTSNVLSSVSDNVLLHKVWLSKYTFDCSNVGVNMVSVYASDSNRNSDSCIAILTVLDTIPPDVTCTDITILLDSNGNTTITLADIDGGSTDACGIDSMIIDTTSFDCSSIGDNNVTLTVVDVNGNTSTCTAIVTVVDDIAPMLNCLPDRMVTIQNTTCTYVVEDFTGVTSSWDNCSSTGVKITQSPDAGTELVLNNETTTVTITAEDNYGNTEVCSFEVFVRCSQVLIIPEFISPDGNGKNDFWVIPELANYPNNKVKIFNRWGNLVYEKSSYVNEFTGKTNVNEGMNKVIGSGNLPEGAYFYIIDLGDNVTTPYVGNLQIRN